MMVIELVLSFKDEYVNADGEVEQLDTMEFAHTLNSPDGFEITGGQIFVENSKTSELQRFAFRIDRADDGTAELVVLEDVD